MKPQIILTLLIVCSSCSIHKKCIEPEIPLPNQFTSIIEADSACIADIHWSEIFTDPLLQDLINQTLTYNKDLLSATARIRELEKLHQIAKANYLFDVGARGYIEHETHNLSSNNQTIDLEIGTKLTISWEADLFGRIRWAKKEALANYLESVEGQKALQMTLIAEIASSYYQLMALDNKLEILTRTLKTREEDRNKARLRFMGGLTSKIPYEQAQVEYASTAALIPNVQRQIKMKENEISLLTGKMPSDILRSKIQRHEISINILHLGIPSDLIKRRPDITAAEQSLKAQMAKVGYSWAERFPRFIINLEGGLENTAFKGFFTAPLTYALSELTAPLFAFGKRKANYDAAIQAYDAERYQYEKKVLQAFKEVNNAVISYSSANKQVELMENLRNATKKYLDLAHVQYINGQINYIDVLHAQRSYLNAKINLSDAICNENIAIIELYKSLGGGWQNKK
ncbi:MAG: efflux transporter outer membrane subunit [Paludibacteraceae bacterium]|nr:efflux transporter outer membrane subunit [Paludibacteraceae bacterium]